MELRLVQRHLIGRETWDAFVDTSDEAWLWHRFDLQEALSTWPGHTDASFAVFGSESRSQFLALVPIYVIPGASVNSLGGVACWNELGPKLKRKVMPRVEDHLMSLARQHDAEEINISLSPMAPSYCGDRCPRVNPLLELKCENTLSQSWIVDLRVSKDALWQRMEGRARTAVRKAQKLGVTSREARPTTDDLDIYYSLHTETYGRTGVRPHPKAYFEAIWNRFLASGLAHILFAEAGGEVVAAENFGVFKRRAIYWTGAASRRGLECEANSLLQWEAMKWMADNDFEWYETGEAFPNVREGKLKGLNDFKRSFGGSLYPFFKCRMRVEKDHEQSEGEACEPSPRLPACSGIIASIKARLLQSLTGKQ